MKYLSQIITAGSGSINGITASHNRSGQYFRSKVIPVNPSSTLQQAVRNAFSELSARWGQILTQVQRDAWELYADNVPLTDKLGQSINVTGLNMYIRSNTPRIQVTEAQPGTLTIVDDGPTNFSLAQVDSMASNAIMSPDSADITYDDTAAWVAEDDAAMIVYTGQPKNESIQFFGGPYRLARAILGNLALPPTSPDQVLTGYQYTIGQKVFSYARISRADGRLSPAFKMPATLAT